MAGAHAWAAIAQIEASATVSPMSHNLHKYWSYVLAADALNDVVRWSAEQLGNDGELIDVVFAGEKRLALEHLGKDAACTPDVDLNVVFLPGEHDFWGAIVSCRDIARHLRVLDSGQAKVANLEIAVLVDENVARLQVTMHDTRRVDVFQASLCKISPCPNAQCGA